MVDASRSSAQLPGPPVGEGETAERLFAEAADGYVAGVTDTDPIIDALPEATTRHLGADARGWTALRREVHRANGAKVAVGAYDVIRCIGAGGMGVVYEAVHRDRGQRVALKTLQEMSPAALLRFKNEFRTAQSVVHPNLCALYELVCWEDKWFFTMEYVEGSSFLQHVRGRTAGPLGFDEARIRSALLELARGVRALHAAGKIHRDLNCSNVLVTEEGRVTILDFGLISGSREAGSFDGLSGTPGYMAPEQAIGDPASTASDWYAVGVMLYEALTGRLPFMGTVRRVLVAKSAMDPSPPSAICKGIPEDLDLFCLSLLRRPPKERPTGEEILRHLGGDLEPAIAEISSEPEALIGRDREIEVLSGALASVAPGRPVSVHVHGLSGMGKSAILRRFLAIAERDHGALVLRGRCYERESVPYKAFDSLIDALAHHLRGFPDDEVAAILPPEFHELARIFPVLEGVRARSRVPLPRFEVRDPQEIRRRAFAGLKDLIRRIGAASPLVLAIDDMQWGDLDSGWLLAELLSPPDPPAILIVTAYRSDAADGRSPPASMRLPRIPGGAPIEAIEIEVGPLSAEHAVALAARHGRARAGAIARESAGIPFLVEELGRHVDEIRLDPGDGERIGLDQLVEARLARLGDAARALIEIIAVAGRPIAQSLAIAASGAGDDAPAALVRLRASCLVRAQGFHASDRVEIYHDRLRDAVIAGISPEAIRRRHEALGRALSACPSADPEVLAAHCAAAGMRAEASAAAEIAAARAEAKLAFDRAAELYGVAIDEGAGDPARARSLLAKRAGALVNAGRGAEAARLFLAAAAGAPPESALDLRRRAAEQLLLTGHVDEGVRALQPVLDAHGVRYPRAPGEAQVKLALRLLELRVRGLRLRGPGEARARPEARAKIDVCWAAGRGLAAADPARSSAYLAEALIRALRAGDLRRAAAGLAFVGHVVTYAGTKSAIARGRELLAEASALAARSEDPYLIAFTAQRRGLAHLAMGEWRLALAEADRSRELLRDRCAGVAWELSVATAGGIQALAALGRLAERSRRAQLWIREATEIGDVFAGTTAALHVAHGHLAADDPQATRAGVEEAIRRAPQGGFSFQHQFAMMIETWCDLYQGRPAAAFARVEAARRASRVIRLQMFRIDLLERQGLIALALADQDAADRARLLRLAEDAAIALEKERRVQASATASLIRAGVAWIQRRVGQAKAHFLAAADRYDTAEMKLYAASARRHLGVISGRPEIVAEADAVLRAEGVVRPDRWVKVYTGLG